MDIERTMEFIVENLADVAARQQRAEIRADRTDRQIRGLQNLAKIGLRLMAKAEQRQTKFEQRQTKFEQRQDRAEAEMAELRQALKELAAAQKRTDARFDRWLDSLPNASNGNRKKKPG